jgi:hypothetical protein
LVSNWAELETVASSDNARKPAKIRIPKETLITASSIFKIVPTVSALENPCRVFKLTWPFSKRLGTRSQGFIFGVGD